MKQKQNQFDTTIKNVKSNRRKALSLTDSPRRRFNHNNMKKKHKDVQSTYFDYCFNEGLADRNVKLQRLQSFQQQTCRNVGPLMTPLPKVLRKVQRRPLRSKLPINRKLNTNRSNMQVQVVIANKRFKKHSLEFKMPHSPNKPKNYSSGVPICDKLINPNYGGIAKIIWIFFFVVFVLCTSYLTYASLQEFFSGKPAVIVDFKQLTHFPAMVWVSCPHNIFSVTNKAFSELRENYKKIFPNNESEIFFSDLLRLPDVDVESLWRYQEVHITVAVTCSVSKKDNECSKWTRCYKVNTAGGLCNLCRTAGNISLPGPVTIVNTKISKPKRLDAHIGILDFYARGFEISEGEKPEYSDTEKGFPSPLLIHGILLGEFIEIKNLNTTSYPCEDSVIVHKCVEDCIDRILYSKIPCRLPFMKNSTVKICDSPLDFNRSIMISTEAMGKNYECRKQCPRKCYERLFIKNAQMFKAPTDALYLTTQIFNLKMPVIKEISLYSLNNLIADIGGSFGFFLGFCCLTFLEVGEYIMKNCRLNIIPKNFTNFSLNKRCSKKATLKPSVSIAGLHRLSKNNPSIASKIIWLGSFLLCTFLCIYQIGKTFQEFEFGNPDSKFVIERNKSVLYPAVTVCPFRPFDNWPIVEALEEIYRMDFNASENEPISFFDLIKLSDSSLLELWNKSSMAISVEIGCKTFSKMEYSDEYNISYRNVITINGLCVTITINPLVKFRDMGTIFCYKFENLPEVLLPYTYTIYFHNEFDDPRTLDPKLGTPLQKSIGGVWSVYIRKRELINRPENPCADDAVVAQCRSQCYEDLLESRVSCRLPFMRYSSLEVCSEPFAFNRTFEAAYSLIINYTEDMWCNCPRKCNEYIYGVNRDEFQLIKGLQLIMIALQFPNNIFLVTREYWKMDLQSLYTNICGFLGLYLGFTAMTALEIIEALIIIIYRKLWSN